MSQWSYVYALIEVREFDHDKVPAFLSRITHALLNAPPITGSEGNADVAVAFTDKKSWSPKWREDYDDAIILAIHGNLRGKRKEDTRREFRNLIQHLKSYGFLANVLTKTIK